MYRCAVIGAAGFTGMELVRLLLTHPQFVLERISSDSEVGKTLAEVNPFFAGRTELSFVEHANILKCSAAQIDFAFLAVPHTAAMDLAGTLLAKGISVIDLSADFRLQQPADYRAWYGSVHSAPELLAKAVYGLPEVYRSQLKHLAVCRASGEAVLVANPGCYPTATTLAALPILAAGWHKPEAVVVVNAISGVTGAGKKPSDITHYCLANENLNAYGVTTHRHTPEICQTFAHVAAEKVAVQFTPHLAPLNRGMVSTVAIALSPAAAEQATAESIQALYEQRYAEEPFVQVLPAGQMPKSSSVKYSNNAQVGVVYDASTQMVVASCAIDNLGKGASAQAVQNANLIFSLKEICGLSNEGGLL